MNRHSTDLVEVALTHAGGKGSSIAINGQDVTRLLRGVTLQSVVGKPTRIVIDLLPAIVRTKVEGHVAIDSASYELLVELGWTPPAEDPS